MRRSVVRWNAAFMRQNGVPEEICPAPPRAGRIRTSTATALATILELTLRAKREGLKSSGIRLLMCYNPCVPLNQYEADSVLSATGGVFVFSARGGGRRSEPHELYFGGRRNTGVGRHVHTCGRGRGYHGGRVGHRGIIGRVAFLLPDML